MPWRTPKAGDDRPAQDTRPFQLGRGREACLLIHGFTGSPWDMRPLGESLAARGFHVRGLRLPGHGRGPDGLEHVGGTDWEEAVEEALLALADYEHVHVVGFSMGALLALLLAARHPGRLGKLVLLAPALRLKGRALALFRALRRAPLLPLLMPSVRKGQPDIADPEVRAASPDLRRFPPARLHELWALQDRAREALPHVTTPTLIVVSKQDHVVWTRGAREIEAVIARSVPVRFVELERGYHLLPRDVDAKRVREEVGAFLVPESRPMGSWAGKIKSADDFDAELPEELLRGFEGE